jgi:hypothetical protein
MYFQSWSLHGALEVLETDFTFDRFGCGVLEENSQNCTEKFHDEHNAGKAWMRYEGDVQISAASLPSCLLWRCARASAGLWLRFPFCLVYFDELRFL